LDKTVPQIRWPSNIADDLREYLQLGSLQKVIEQSRQQLLALNAFSKQQRRGVGAMIALQTAGFTTAAHTRIVYERGFVGQNS
jgi:hypothetical protein